MEEKKDKSDDPVVDLFPDDDADDRAGRVKRRLHPPLAALSPFISPFLQSVMNPLVRSPELAFWVDINLK